MGDEKKRDDYDVERSPGERNTKAFESSSSARTVHTPASSSMTNNALLPILSYCGSSILMTVTNKYVLSGFGFNLSFFLLCVQVSLSNS